MNITPERLDEMAIEEAVSQLAADGTTVNQLRFARSVKVVRVAGQRGLLVRGER